MTTAIKNRKSLQYPKYYDRTQVAGDQQKYRQVLVNPARAIQASELIEMQSILNEYGKAYLDTKLKNGSILTGLNLQEIDADTYSVTDGLLYWDGTVYTYTQTAETIAYKTEDYDDNGILSIYIIPKYNVVTYTDDTALYDPAVKYHNNVNLPGANRLQVTFTVSVTAPTSGEQYFAIAKIQRTEVTTGVYSYDVDLMNRQYEFKLNEDDIVPDIAQKINGLEVVPALCFDDLIKERADYSHGSYVESSLDSENKQYIRIKNGTAELDENILINNDIKTFAIAKKPLSSCEVSDEINSKISAGGNYNNYAGVYINVAPSVITTGDIIYGGSSFPEVLVSSSHDVMTEQLVSVAVGSVSGTDFAMGQWVRDKVTGKRYGYVTDLWYDDPTLATISKAFVQVRLYNTSENDIIPVGATVTVGTSDWPLTNVSVQTSWNGLRGAHSLLTAAQPGRLMDIYIRYRRDNGGNQEWYEQLFCRAVVSHVVENYMMTDGNGRPYKEGYRVYLHKFSSFQTADYTSANDDASSFFDSGDVFNFSHLTDISAQGGTVNTYSFGCNIIGPAGEMLHVLPFSDEYGCAVPHNIAVFPEVDSDEFAETYAYSTTDPDNTWPTKLVFKTARSNISYVKEATKAVYVSSHEVEKTVSATNFDPYFPAYVDLKLWRKVAFDTTTEKIYKSLDVTCLVPVTTLGVTYNCYLTVPAQAAFLSETGQRVQNIIEHKTTVDGVSLVDEIAIPAWPMSLTKVQRLNLKVGASVSRTPAIGDFLVKAVGISSDVSAYPAVLASLSQYIPAGETLPAIYYYSPDYYTYTYGVYQVIDVVSMGGDYYGVFVAFVDITTGSIIDTDRDDYSVKASEELAYSAATDVLWLFGPDGKAAMRTSSTTDQMHWHMVQTAGIGGLPIGVVDNILYASTVYGGTESSTTTIQLKRGFTGYSEYLIVDTLSGTTLSKTDTIRPGHVAFPGLCPDGNAIAGVSGGPRAMDSSVRVASLMEVDGNPDFISLVARNTKDLYSSVDTINVSDYEAYPIFGTNVTATVAVTASDYYHVDNSRFGFRLLDDFVLSSANLSTTTSELTYGFKAWVNVGFTVYIPDIVHFYMNRDNEIKYINSGASLSNELKEISLANDLYLGTANIPPVGYMNDMNVINSYGGLLQTYLNRLSDANVVLQQSNLQKVTEDHANMSRIGNETNLIGDLDNQWGGICYGVRVPIAIYDNTGKHAYVSNMSVYDAKFPAPGQTISSTNPDVIEQFSLAGLALLDIGAPVYYLNSIPSSTTMSLSPEPIYLGRVKSKSMVSYGKQKFCKITLLISSLPTTTVNTLGGVFTTQATWYDKALYTVANWVDTEWTTQTNYYNIHRPKFVFIGSTFGSGNMPLAESAFVPKAYTYYPTYEFYDTLRVKQHELMNTGMLDLSRFIDDDTYTALINENEVDSIEDVKERLFLDKTEWTTDPVNHELAIKTEQSGSALTKSDFSFNDDTKLERLYVNDDSGLPYLKDTIVKIKTVLDDSYFDVVNTGGDANYGDTLDIAYTRAAYPCLYLKDVMFKYSEFNALNKYNAQTYAYGYVKSVEGDNFKSTKWNLHNVKLNAYNKSETTPTTKNVLNNHIADNIVAEKELLDTVVTASADINAYVGFAKNEFDAASVGAYDAADKIVGMNLLFGSNKCTEFTGAIATYGFDTYIGGTVKTAVVAQANELSEPMYIPLVLDVYNGVLELAEQTNGIYSAGVRTSYATISVGTLSATDYYTDVITKIKFNNGLRKYDTQYSFIEDNINRPLMFRHSEYEDGETVIPMRAAQIYRFDTDKMISKIQVGYNYTAGSGSTTSEPIVVHFGFAINGKIDPNGIVHSVIVNPTYENDGIFAVVLNQPIYVQRDSDFFIGFTYAIDTATSKRLLLKTIKNGSYSSVVGGNPDLLPFNASIDSKLIVDGDYENPRTNELLKIDLYTNKYLLNTDDIANIDEMFELTTGTITNPSMTDVVKFYYLESSIVPNGTFIEHYYLKKIAEDSTGNSSYVWESFKPNTEVFLRYAQNSIGFKVRLSTENRDVTPILKESSIHAYCCKYSSTSNTVFAIPKPLELHAPLNLRAKNTLIEKSYDGGKGYIYYKNLSYNYNVYENNWYYYNVLENNGSKLPLEMYTLKMGLDFYDPGFKDGTDIVPRDIRIGVSAKYFNKDYVQDYAVDDAWCKVHPIYGVWQNQRQQVNPLGIGYNLQKLGDGWWRQTYEFIPVVECYISPINNLYGAGILDPRDPLFVMPTLLNLWTFRFELAMETVNGLAPIVRNVTTNANKLKIESATDLPLWMMKTVAFDPQTFHAMYPNYIS